VSTDLAYNGLDPPDVGVTNADNEIAGITVTPTSGLETTEAGDVDTFTIVLDTEPSDAVTIGISSNDTSEGTVDPESVTFTHLNWDTPQTITVTGQNDAVVDGDVPYTIVTAAAASTDGNYNGMNPPDVSATNFDNEVAGEWDSTTWDGCVWGD